MWSSKESRQSAQVYEHVLNLPLYDGDCSPRARELLAIGDVEGVLAYIYLFGAPSLKADLDEARRLASSAQSGERGYANYLLAVISLKENNAASAIKCMTESFKAGFVPAGTFLASITLQTRDASSQAKKTAIRILRRASAAGHRPADLLLCSAYVRGSLGLARRLLGICLAPIAIFRLVVANKYQVFSIDSFHYSSREKRSLFVEGLKPTNEIVAYASSPFLNILRITHVGAAILAAVVLFVQPGRSALGWVVLAVWPYGLSYLYASSNNARRLIGTLAQTLMLCTITAYVCSAFAGQLLDFHLGGWMIGVITLLQAFLLVLACATGAAAAKQAEPTAEPIRYRNPILVALILLGLIATGSVFARPDHLRMDYLRRFGFDVMGQVLLSFLPYLAVSIFLWRLTTSDRLKPWIFLGFIIIVTALAVINNCGLGAVQPGYLSVEFFVWWQLVGFVAAATWASDRYEW